MFLELILSLTINFLSTDLKQTKILTPVNKYEIVQVMEQTHQSVFQKPAKTNRIAMAWAQIALENSHFQKVYSFNFGNIGSSTNVPHYILGGHRFRAFPEPKSGMEYYWKTINNMCSMAFKYFDAGLPEKASFQLHRCGYFRSDPEVYAKNLRSLYFYALSKIIK